MTVGEWRIRAADRLAGDMDAEIDAIWILEEVLGLSRAAARGESSRILSGDEICALDAALSRRASGEPIQYIFSRAPFMGFEFFVDKRVLIPRMDTENLCDAASKFLKKRPNAKVLDLCAGSGAIGISLARLFPDARVTLSDISPDAGAVQRINSPDAEILTGDMFETVAGRRFDLITCNPPYIRRDELPRLQAEVLREPALALDGGADGLDFYRRLSREYADYLAPGGRIYMEIGAGQARDVCPLFGDANILLDLNGIERVIWTEV